MARKSKSRNKNREASADTAQAVRDSAHRIWLAGLGAFERAKTDGPRMFETLVEQGRSMGARAVGAADEALKSLRQANYSGGAKWDKLEQVFEERVSRSLNRLGVLTRAELDELSQQVRDLNENVRSMMAGNARGGKSAAGARGARAGTKKKAAAKARGGAKKKRATRASRAPQA